MNDVPGGSVTSGLLGIVLSSVILLFVGMALISAAPHDNETNRLSRARQDAQSSATELYRNARMSFESNQGQENPDVRFSAHGRGYRVFLTNDGADFASTARSGPSRFLRMKLLGANQAPYIRGVGRLPKATNYFRGRDPSRWKTNVPNYARVECDGVYRGIDLVYHANGSELEYDFIIHQGARPSDIRLSISGQLESAAINANGELELRNVYGDLHFRRPVVYQLGLGGERHLVESHYLLAGRVRQPVTGEQELEASIETGPYDPSQALIIDPVLTFSTYFGGSSSDLGEAIAADSAGNVYIAGGTYSTDFPTSSPIQGAFSGGEDAFITKINAAGSAILYSTYLGGSNIAQANGIAVDSTGNAFVVGQTNSGDFPVTTGAFDTSCSTCGANAGVAFISKLDSTGSRLLYSTYLGGTGGDATGDRSNAIVVDPSGSAYITGGSFSPDFPITPGAFQKVRTGIEEVFVTKLNATGSALDYSTYLGPGEGFGIAVNASGSAYVAGGASSAFFPTTSGAFQTVFGGSGGGNDAFITQLNGSGSALVYSTFLGGNNEDYAGGIGIDNAGNAYVAGQTFSTNFPVLNAYQQTLKGAANAYVAKLNPSGSGLVYSTYLGGSSDDAADAIAVDPAGRAYVTGFAQSTDFPLVGALQDAYGGGIMDAFLTVFDTDGAPFFSTFLGGTNTDQGNGVATDSSGNVYLTGVTQSTNFPVGNPLQAALATQATISCSPSPCSDAFVTKFAVATATPSPDFALVPSSATASVNSGGTATYNIGLTPIGGFNQKVSLSCSGQPTLSTCSILPSSLTSTGLSSPVATVQISTTASSPIASRPRTTHERPFSPLFESVFGGCATLSLLRFGRKSLSRLSCALRLLVVLVLVTFTLSCGGGGSSGGGSQGTLPGQYTIIVTGTAGSLNHSVNLTLKVN